MMDDEHLLHAYTRERSESAFGELVTRHIDFVYSTPSPPPQTFFHFLLASLPV
jgi:hypothetical protein